MKRSDNILSKLGGASDIMVWLVPLLLLIPNIALDITEISYSWADKAVNIQIGRAHV